MSGIYTLFPKQSQPVSSHTKSSQNLAPFLGDQRLRWLQVPETAAMEDVRKCLKPEFFRAARADAKSLNDLAATVPELEGFQWIEVAKNQNQPEQDRSRRDQPSPEELKQQITDAQRQRENYLRDPSRKRLCLMVESGTGKTIAMRQAQYLRSTNPGHLAIGFQFAEIPVSNNDGSSLHVQIENFLLSRLKDELSTQDERAVERTLRRAIHSGNLTLVVDALDQTKGTEAKVARAKMLAAFLAVESTHPSVACIVAGRPYSVTGEIWEELFAGDPSWCFTLIDDFDESQQRRYIDEDRWTALKMIEAAALSQPRLLEAVRKLKPKQLTNVRTAAELHWLVLNDTFDASNRGHDDNRRKVDWLLALIAYTMHRDENLVGVDEGEFSDSLVKMQDQIERLPQKDRRRTEFVGDFDKLETAINELATRNVELNFAMLQESGTAQIYFRSRTLQDFYAAYWLSYIHCNADDQSWLASIRKSEQHEEFWRLLTEMPPDPYATIPSRQHDIHWVRSMAVLFRPIDDEAYPVRCSQWMYRAWWNLLLTSGQGGADAPQQFFIERHPSEDDFNIAVRAMQKQTQCQFEIDGRPPDWNAELPDDAGQAAKILLTDHLREFLAIKSGTLAVPKIADAVDRAKWFWEPSETSGFVTIPKGKFPMGENRPFGKSRSAYSREEEHEAEIEHPFELHRHPITEHVYQLFDGQLEVNKGPLAALGDVNWYDAWTAATWLHGCLPTEQQWERACRGPEPYPRTFFSFGDDEKQLAEYAWFGQSLDTGPFEVLGSKLPNKFGLYHMHGMVWEWTANWYREKAWQQNRRTHLSRVLRGGSFDVSADYCRSSYRVNVRPQNSGHIVGFRVSRA